LLFEALSLPISSEPWFGSESRITIEAEGDTPNAIIMGGFGGAAAI